MRQSDTIIDWEEAHAEFGGIYARHAAIRAMDARFRAAVRKAHPDLSAAPPATPKAAAAPHRRVRDYLIISASGARWRSSADGSTPPLLWRLILREVAAKHGLTAAEILSARRDKTVVLARQETIWRLSKETSMSLPAIGKKMGRDHTTVLYSIRRPQARLDTEALAR